MTRRVVAFEGKPTVDKRLLIPCSLTVKDDVIPVTMGTTYKPDDLIGKATDFERDSETGEISFDINTKDELPEKLNGHIFCTGLKHRMEDDVMIIESAVIRSIYFSEAPQGWTVLDRIKNE